MLQGGKKKNTEPEEKDPETLGKDIPMRVLSMPPELRNKPAQLPPEAVIQKKEAVPEVLPPIIIPIPVSDAAPEVIKKRISPVLIVLFVLVLMGGTGVGVWWYLVTYATPEQIIVEVPTQEVTEPQPDPVVGEPYPGIDTDSDGLTNIEELLYGTDFRSPDTDSDTFLDGNEVFHRYDPNGLAPSTLLDTGAVRIFERTNVPFTIFYPASWSVSAAAVDTSVVFRSTEGESIDLIYEEKDALTTLTTWMKDQDISLKSTEETMTKEGYPARVAEDGRTVYLDLGNGVVSAVYNLDETFSIDFLQTFKMMINSVVYSEATRVL